ncbi:hypothetical protein [Methylobacterium pseudosasicola]|uniref:Uncharacterized protein n=1 Tax=Methylobacterium pseudosasicola TaxID=582667 RepID=A0A1I4THW2_9HYPH|nr:hypothetical protein [Methylobacterium pseudosasicola]SFM76272.1 hypothetical protein SAMN05192568_10546 [Methylobacterium pseudosasicola]
MPNALAGLRRDRAKASDRMTKLATAARGRSMTDDEQHDFDAAARDVAGFDEQIAAVESSQTETKDKTVSRADAAEIVKLCVDGGVPMMASGMLAEGVSVEDAKSRIAAAGKAKDLVALARRKDPGIPADLAATMLAEGKSVEDIRTALFDKLVAAEEKTAISSHVPTAAADGPTAGITAAQSSMQRTLKRAGLVKDA